MTDVSPLLRVEGISVRRGGRALLDGVSFTARAGEIVGVIGPNGAGKTTLFEAIAGLTAAVGGRALLSSRASVEGPGRVGSDAGATARPGRSTTLAMTQELFYLPDAIRPWPERRAGWCLDFFARLFGRERDSEAVEALQLGALLAQRIGSLSKGEAKRVALALALGTPQPILLLDEPFDGLDFRQARGAMALLRSRAAAGRTLILSIHQLPDAARVCDRFLLLDHGRAIGEGDLAALRARVGQPDATLEEVFLALE